MTVLLDARPHAEAATTAISTALAPWEVFDYGHVPGADGNEGDLPDIYALLTVERRANPNLRLSAQASRVGWRLTVRVVGTDVDETRWALRQVSAALNERRLPIVVSDDETRPTSPIQFESDQSPEPDDGRYAALSSWTYAH